MINPRVIAALTCLSMFASLGFMVPRSSATSSSQEPPQIKIGGLVLDKNGQPISDVSVLVTGSRRAGTVTGPEGRYEISLPRGGTYTVTSSRYGMTFQPPDLTFSNVVANISNANFVGTQVGTFRVSGTITDAAGRPSGDIVIKISDSPQVLTVSGPAGFYTFDHLTAGASYTLTPSRAGFTFEPPSFTIANLNRDFAGINFITVPQDRVRISGIVADSAGLPLPDVIVGLSGPEPALITTGSAGAYAFTVPSGGNYLVAPAQTGYTFTPPSLTFSNLTRNQSAANFVGVKAPTFTISGFVFDSSGSPMVDVPVSVIGSANGTAPTGPIGNYSFTVLASGSYTIAPSVPGIAFTPPSRGFTNLSSDLTGVNFVGRVAAPGSETNPTGIIENATSPSPSPTPSPSPSPRVRPSPEPTATPSPEAGTKDPAKKNAPKSTENQTKPAAPVGPSPKTAPAKKTVGPRKRSRVRRSRLRRRPAKKVVRKRSTRPKSPSKARAAGTPGRKSRRK